MTIFNIAIPGYWIIFLGVLIIIGLNYFIGRSEKKWKKLKSDKRNNLLEKIRSTEIVPSSEFQDYFGKTFSGKISYDGNILIIAPHSFYFGTVIVLCMIVFCIFCVYLFLLHKEWPALFMLGICLFFFIVVSSTIFREKSLHMNISANTYSIAYGFLRQKLKEGDLSEIRQIEMYEGDEGDWTVILSWEEPFFTIRHICCEHECRVLAEDLSHKLNIKLAQSKYSDKF